VKIERRHRVDVAMVAIAVLLVVGVFVDQDSITSAEAEDRKYQLLDAWRPDDVSRLEIRIGENHLVIQDGDDGWSMSEDGHDVAADDQAIDQLLVSLEFASFQRPVDGLDEATMGLDKPRASYALTMGSLSYRVVLGAEAPTPKGAAYASVEGGARGKQRYVVGAELVTELMIEPGSLRSRQLLPYLSIDVRAFELGGAFTLERGKWGGRTAGQFLVKVAGRPDVRADRRAVDGWLTMLGRLQVERFVPVPKTIPDSAPLLRISPLDDRAVGELVLGMEGCPAGQRLVVRAAPDPAAGCVPEDALKPLLIDAASLADRFAVGTARGDVTEIRWKSKAREVEIARYEEGWRMRTPVEGPAETEPAEAALGALLDVQGERLTADEVAERGLAELGLEEPRAIVQLRGLPERSIDDASERVERIAVGAQVDGAVFVQRSDDEAVLRIDAEQARAFLPRPAALRSTQLFDVELKDVRGLELDCAGKRQRMGRLPAGSWLLEEPELAIGVDIGEANQLADNYRKMKALRWVAEEPDEGHGLARPWCRVALVIQQGDENKHLRLALGAETQGGYFAQRDGEPTVFVAPKGLGLAARQWLLDRSALLLNQNKITKVALSGKGRERSVERSGATWSDPRFGDVATSALGQLLAEGIVSLGPAPADGGFDEPLLRIVVDSEGGTQRRLVVGRAEVFRSASVYLVRDEAIDVTFAVARTRLQPLLDAL
jgi:Domain of unknown function (DUF4340)